MDQSANSARGSGRKEMEMKQRCNVCGGREDDTGARRPIGDVLCFNCHMWAIGLYQVLLWGRASRSLRIAPGLAVASVEVAR